MLGTARVQPQHPAGRVAGGAGSPGRRAAGDLGGALLILAHRGRGGPAVLPSPGPHGPPAGPPVLRRLVPRARPGAWAPRGPWTPEDAVLSTVYTPRSTGSGAS